MTARKPGFAEVVEGAFEARQRRIHTQIVGQITAYDPAKQTVDVQPSVLRVWLDPDGNEVSERYPKLSSVPLLVLQGGGFFTSYPVAVGEHVVVLFMERSIDQWRAKGKETDPADLRLHSTTSAVAISGIVPTAKVLADVHPENMVLGKDGGAQIHIKPNGEIHLYEENAAAFLAKADKVDAQISAIKNLVDKIADLLIPYAGATAPFVGTTLTPLKAALATAISSNPVATTKVKAT